MGLLFIFLMALAPYFFLNRLARKHSRAIILVPAVIIAVPITVALGLAYPFAVYEASNPLRETAITQSFGMGFWFALFGAIIGAIDGRRRAKKTQTKHEVSDQ